MVIEDPVNTLKSKWFKTYDAAEKEAKSMASEHSIKWNPKPYGDRSRFE